MNIAFTGPRTMTKQQELETYKNFDSAIAKQAANWHVGDAAGLDNFVRRAYGYYSQRSGYRVENLTVYEVEGTQAYHFAERSKRMIDALADSSNPWLYAFPNKPCPEGCKPSKNCVGKGSGTWLTIAYAKYRGLPISLYLLEKDLLLPDWLFGSRPKQLTLL